MYDDSLSNIYNDSSSTKKDGIKSNWVVIGLIILSLIISYFVLFKDLFKSKNTKMEEEMVSKAKDYVLRNNIMTNKEIYLDVSKLGVNLSNNCSLTSGVVFDGELYIPNLICNDYKSDIIKTNEVISDYIKLKGDEVIVLAKGMTYYEPGYESNDVVTIVGNVGSEEGVYNVYYKATNSNSIASRKIIIIDDQTIRNLFPILSLNGEEVIYLVEGNEYVDDGVNAYDTVDGNITNNIIVDGKVNNNVVGEYTIGYTIVNSRGYSSTITRKINVISENSDLVIGYTLYPRNLTNESVLITLNISNDISKIIYPNGEEGKDLTYEVEENGIYRFMVYDKYNRVIEKEIEIDNIYNTIPEGSCVATRYYNKTEINVNISTDNEMSSYEYIINGSNINSQSNFYSSPVVKPSIVKVNLKDIVGNTNEINCTFVDKLSRNIITDKKGKNCLEGFTCYVQHDYSNGRLYPYCSMANNPNTCGGIGRNGCSITSATNVIAAMGVKSKTGVLHNPYTVWDELYPVNKKTGQCGGGCSGWSRIRDSIVNAGLSAPRKVSDLNRNTLPTLIEHLKKGYPAVIYAQGRPFSHSKAHYLSLLGIREDGYVFISDSDNTSGINKATYNGKQYYVDTWIDPEDLITGNVKQFLLVGPYGLYEGK